MHGDRSLIGIFVLTVALTAVLILYPAWHALELSFHAMSSFVSAPEWVGLDNYAAILSRPDFWAALGRGIVYAGLTIALQLGLGIGFALLLDARLPVKALFRGVAVLPYLLPTVIVVLTFKWMFDATSGVMTEAVQPLGLAYVPWGEDPVWAMLAVVLISTWIWTPFVTLAFLAGLQSIPQEYYEAARVDGATPLRQFWHITLPQLRPVLTVVLLLRAIWMFNKFDVIWLLTRGGPMGATEHLPVLAYRETFEAFDVGSGAAVSAISFLILSVFVAIYFQAFPLDEKESRDER